MSNNYSNDELSHKNPMKVLAINENTSMSEMNQKYVSAVQKSTGSLLKTGPDQTFIVEPEARDASIESRVRIGLDAENVNKL